MADTDSQKYQCGCGKAYTSYPAFSTHKRLKHNNEQIIGTQLPQQYIPKRGRPSFALPTSTRLHANTYAALTIAELAILRLQEAYGQVLSEPEVEPDNQLILAYDQFEQSAVLKIEQEVIRAIRNFNQIFVNHSSQSIRVPVSSLLAETTQFFLEGLKLKSSRNGLLVDGPFMARLDGTLFNEFLRLKKRRDRVEKLAEQAGKPLKFLLQILVALSEYMCKLGLLDSVLKMKL